MSGPKRFRAGARVYVAMALMLLPALVRAWAPAEARAVPAAPHWALIGQAQPTYFTPGTDNSYELAVSNDGGADTARGSLISVSDTLPAGVTATAISASGGQGANAGQSPSYRLECPHLPATGTITCTYETGPRNLPVAPGSVIFLILVVTVPEGVGSVGPNTMTVSGGGAPTATLTQTTPVSAGSAAYGLDSFAMRAVDAAGNPDTQAGSHPYEIQTSFLLHDPAREDISSENATFTTTSTKDLEVALPPGVVGDPEAVPRCPQAAFQAGESAACPVDTQVGTIRTIWFGSFSRSAYPVYNIQPPPGQPAELGVTIAGVGHVPLLFHVRSDGDYGITAQLQNVSQAGPIRGSILDLWGVPADPSHDNEREGTIGLSEIDGPICRPNSQLVGEELRLTDCHSSAPPAAFLTLPGACSAEPQPVLLRTDSWQNPEPLAPFTEVGALPGMSGCGELPFAPRLVVTPGSTAPGAPSGYDVGLHVPQDEEPTGLATPDIRRAVVTLPAGTVPSPAAASGLQACSDGQFGRHSLTASTCPPASQIGTVTVRTPLLEKPLEGQAFLGAPQCGPCSPGDAQEGRLLRLFLQVEGPGVIVKLEGTTSVNQGDGQLTTTFDNAPQLPFEDLHVALQSGPQAPLANPQECGAAATVADLTPWSGPATPDASPSSAFEVVGCPSQQPFEPTFAAGTLGNGAAASSPFVTSFARPDGDQELSQVSVRLPPGLIGNISAVTPCPEPQAAAGACPASSLLGHIDASAGPGPLPLHIPEAGRASDPVYLTGPYRGAPFGLSIPVAAEAGPFNLGTIVVRGTVAVDKDTSQVTVTTDPLPQAQDGIPLQLRGATVTIDRAGFMLNPTDCEPLTLTATLAGTGGAVVPASTRFQAANCAVLPFKPALTASTSAHTSRLNGASLDVKLRFPAGTEANVRAVKVDLPAQLPSRLTTLQKACTAQVFAANPAACPQASVVGVARAQTPVLPVQLTGPVYLVSHGGEAFPNVVAVLQGDGVRVDLTGQTLIRHGITSSNFAGVPDVPVSSFELYLPQGRFSALAANGSFCKHKLHMPTRITGQNGAVIATTTTIKVNGCTKPARKKARRKRRARR